MNQNLIKVLRMWNFEEIKFNGNFFNVHDDIDMLNFISDIVKIRSLDYSPISGYHIRFYKDLISINTKKGIGITPGYQSCITGIDHNNSYRLIKKTVGFDYKNFEWEQ